MPTKVLLVYPVPSVSSPQKSSPLSIFHVGEALKQAKARGRSDESYEVRYIDCRYDDPTPDDFLWCDIAGISSMTGMQLKGAIHWLKTAKQYGKRTILGGIHVTMQPDQCLSEDYVDAVVLSEGEWGVIEAIHGGPKQRVHSHLSGTADHVSPVSSETLIHFQRSARTGDTVLMTSRGCPFRCGFAVHEDSVVSTLGGSKPASRIKVGDVVMGYNEEEQCLDVTTVTAVVYPTAEEEIEIVTESGRVLRCSPEHPLFTKRGWINAGELTDSDEVLVVESQ